MKVKRFKVNFPWTTAGWLWIGLAILYTLYEIVKELGGDYDLIIFLAFLFVITNVVSRIWNHNNEGEGVISDSSI